MTITTTPDQQESTPLPVEPPSAPAPETVEPPVNEATQPMDAVTVEAQNMRDAAPAVTAENIGSPMIVKETTDTGVIRDLRRQIARLEAELAKAERAKENAVKEAQRHHKLFLETMRAVGTLNANRDRTMRRAAAYRKTLAAARHQVINLQTIIALQKGELEAAQKAASAPTDWRLKLDTAQQRIDQLERDLARAEEANSGGGLIYGHDAAYWYRAWSRLHAISTGYQTAGDTVAFVAGAEQKASVQS